LVYFLKSKISDGGRLSNEYFTKGWRFFLHRFYSEARCRSFFNRRSGSENQLTNYTCDLEKYPRRLVILPERFEELSVWLPLFLYLQRTSKEENIFFISPHSHRPILKAVGLQKNCYLYSPYHFRFGEKDFHDLETFIQAEQFDLCLFFDSDMPLLKLYLAKLSQASIRLGMLSDEAYPFLNVSLVPASKSRCLYTLRETFFHHFGLPEKEILDKAARHAKPDQAGHDESHLPGRHVFLLNMEPDLSGKPWSAEQITSINRALEGKYRLLALFPGGESQKNKAYQDLLNKLQIRIAPIPSNSGALLDLIRQYAGLISRNSGHAHLCLNLGTIPTLLIQDESGAINCNPDPKTHQLQYAEDQSEISAESIKEFIRFSAKDAANG